MTVSGSDFTSPVEYRPHTLYRYTDQVFKIVQFYKVRLPRFGIEKKESQHYDFKLDASLSRSRRVLLELALCNRWDYFCTFTQDKALRDRVDLKKFHSDLTQFIRDQRKKGFPIKFVFVPELHEDGTSWHVHGLLTGVPSDQLISFAEMDRRGYRTPAGRRLPLRLRNSSFMNWTAYQSKFGFCSLGKIRNPVASGFYITKYITKESDRMVREVGLQSYWPSRNGLLKAEKHLDFYGRDPSIDALLTNKYEFCKTGMTFPVHGLDWSFGSEFIDFYDLAPLDISDFEIMEEVEEVEAFDQLIMEFC